MFEGSYFDLTEEQRKKAKTLTPKERDAADCFLAAAKALPRSLCIALEDGELTVSKRITVGSCAEVAKLRKRSLEF